MLPSIDAGALLAEDEQRRDPNPLRYALPTPTWASPATHGTWEPVDGGRLWRLRVHSPGATDLNFAFTRYWLPRGATLHVWVEEGGYYEGPYLASDNKEHGELWTPVVPGDRAVLELFVSDQTQPAAASPRPEFLSAPTGPTAGPELLLTQVGQGYRDLFKGRKDFVDAGACNNDVVCSGGGFSWINSWRDEIRSVAGYSTGGSIFCTGTLIMDVPGSFTPWFLTAYHCGITSTNDQSLVVYWNFESPTCGAQCCGDLSQNQTGSTLRARRQDVDSCLLELDNRPDSAYNVHYAGWDRTGNPPPGSVGIHHPNGDEKSISRNDNALTYRANACISGTGPNTHWDVDDWEDGTTEPGSSGSGLWDIGSNLLVGFLSGGIAACPDNNGWDCYGRFDVAWDGSSSSNRLLDWLDPGNTGTNTVAGSDPPPEPALVYDSHSIDDSAGNNDGVVDPGEAIVMPVTLGNEGTGTATGVGATLSTTEPGITITDNSATWNNINVGATQGSNNPHFAFTVGGSVTCGTLIPFSLAMTANEAPGSWSDGFSQYVGAPGGVISSNGYSGPAFNVSDGGTASRTLAIGATGPITDLDVDLDVSHSYVGDLTFVLTHLDTGTSVTLVDRPGHPASQYGCSGSDILATLDDEATDPIEDECAGGTPTINGTFTPENPLSAFDGEDVSGDWQLTVVDAITPDGGRVNGWTLQITTAEWVCDTGCTQPAAPGAPSFGNLTCDSVTVSWGAVAGATLYDVERKDNGCAGGGWATVATDVGATSFDDSGLAANSTYSYRITAKNACGNSGPGSCASTTTLQTVGTPSGLTATGTCAGIDLAWSAASGATSYDILRGDSCGNVVVIDTGVVGTTYTDTTAAAGTPYSYTVRGVNACGPGTQSNCDGATRLACPNLVYETGSYGFVQVVGDGDPATMIPGEKWQLSFQVRNVGVGATAADANLTLTANNGVGSGDFCLNPVPVGVLAPTALSPILASQFIVPDGWSGTCLSDVEIGLQSKLHNGGQPAGSDEPPGTGNVAEVAMTVGIPGGGSANSYPGTGGAIPDNTGVPFSDSVNPTDSPSVTSAVAYLTVTHERIGDVNNFGSAQLLLPGGGAVDLTSLSSGVERVVDFTSQYNTAGPGTYTLEVLDAKAGKVGTVDAWRIEITTSGPPTAAPGPWARPAAPPPLPPYSPRCSSTRTAGT